MHVLARIRSERASNGIRVEYVLYSILEYALFFLVQRSGFLLTTTVMMNVMESRVCRTKPTCAVAKCTVVLIIMPALPVYSSSCLHYPYSYSYYYLRRLCLAE